MEQRTILVEYHDPVLIKINPSNDASTHLKNVRQIGSFPQF